MQIFKCECKSSVLLRLLFGVGSVRLPSVELDEFLIVAASHNVLQVRMTLDG